MTLLLNQLRAVTVRLRMPWTGVWTADVDVDLDLSHVVPSGLAALTVGESILPCAIDPSRGGAFGEKSRLRVLGGAGGWEKEVRSQHFKNDAGVLSTAVISATAAEVKERAVVLSPQRLGVDFVRTKGPASRVLSGMSWYVEPFTGTTIVGPRPEQPAIPTEVEVLTWDPQNSVAEIATDRVLVPGTVLLDTRFGTAIVRDVEQTFREGSARATAWCDASARTRLLGALRTLIREEVSLDALKVYLYRVVTQGPDDRVFLQAVDRSDGVPDVLPITIWTGMTGVSARVLLGTECLVMFRSGDRARPFVLGFDASAVPLELRLRAVRIALGAGTQPIAKAPGVLALVAALQTEIAALAGVVATEHPSRAGDISAITGAATAAIAVSSALTPSPLAFTD